MSNIVKSKYWNFDIDIGTPPWHGMHATDIETEVVQKKKMLVIEETMKEPFSTLLQQGLAVEPLERGLTLEQFVNSLTHVLTVSSSPLKSNKCFELMLLGWDKILLLEE